MKVKIILFVCMLIVLLVGCSSVKNTSDSKNDTNSVEGEPDATLTLTPKGAVTISTNTPTMMPSPTVVPTKRIKKLKGYYDGTNTTEYEYDNEGNICRTIIHEGQMGRVISDSYKEYDENGRLLKETTKSENRTSVTTYSYDGMSASIVTETTLLNGTVSIENAYEEYDEKGHTILHRDSFSEKTETYDANNRLSESTSTQMQEPFTKRRTVYEYIGDSDDYSRISHFTGDEDTPSTINEYRWSQGRDVLYIAIYTKTGLLHSRVNKYEYDEDGDYIKLFNYLEDKGEMYLTFEYSYWYDYVEVNDE